MDRCLLKTNKSYVQKRTPLLSRAHSTQERKKFEAFISISAPDKKEFRFRALWGYRPAGSPKNEPEKRGRGSECSLSCAARERPHKNYIHTRTRNLLTKHEISQMAARVSPARPAGDTRKAMRLILRRTSKPGGATPTLQRNTAYFCLSFARLSLAWIFALGRVLA